VLYLVNSPLVVWLRVIPSRTLQGLMDAAGFPWRGSASAVAATSSVRGFGQLPPFVADAIISACRPVLG
jgi:hypothetical protein